MTLPRHLARAAVLVLGLGALLAGCSTPADLKPSPAQSLDVRGDRAGVVVTVRWLGVDPYPAAEAHCARFGRIPSFGRVEGRATRFDCVAPAVGR